MNKIYVVNGSDGEYDGFYTWDVAAFVDEAAAKVFMGELKSGLRKDPNFAGRKRQQKRADYGIAELEVLG